jgi:hypothetical protein
VEVLSDKAAFPKSLAGSSKAIQVRDRSSEIGSSQSGSATKSGSASVRTANGFVGASSEFKAFPAQQAASTRAPQSIRNAATARRCPPDASTSSINTTSGKSRGQPAAGQAQAAVQLLRIASAPGDVRARESLELRREAARARTRRSEPIDLLVAIASAFRKMSTRSDQSQFTAER